MQKRFWLLFSLFLSLFSPQIICAQGYSIRLSLAEYTNAQILVTYYYFGNMYVKDTLQTNNDGNTNFVGDKPLQQGIYQLYFSKDRQIDFLVGEDQHFKIFLKKDDPTPHIEGAHESERFQEYLNLMTRERTRYETLSARKKSAEAQIDSVAFINRELREISAQLDSFRIQEGQKYDDTFYGKFVAATYTPQPRPSQVPEQWLANDSLRWVYEYNFRKQHYWDHFDLGDWRMWHTPYIKKRLEDYLNTVLLQHPDSVLSEAIRLIEQHRDMPSVFQNLTSFILNNSIQSRIMGMENVFVALAEKYYLSGQASWANDETMKQIRQEVAIRKNNLIGGTARELLLEDAQGNFHSLKQQPTPYTIVAFWEPDCGHCQTKIPRLYHEIFLKANPSKLGVYTVYTMNDQTAWLQFIKEKQIPDWINVWDPHQTSHFREWYGIRTTPSLFLLDQDKKIVAKNIDINTLKQVLHNLGVL